MKPDTKKASTTTHGLTIQILHVSAKTDVDATVQHVRGVIEQVISASGDNIIVTGEIGIEHIDQADPEPEPAETSKSEYRFPPFGE